MSYIIPDTLPKCLYHFTLITIHLNPVETLHCNVSTTTGVY